MKNYYADVAEEMCSKMIQEFEKISLSCWTIARRIDELAGDVFNILKDKVKNFVSWTCALSIKHRCEERGTVGNIYKRSGQRVEQNRRTSVTTVYERYYNCCKYLF